MHDIYLGAEMIHLITGYKVRDQCCIECANETYLAIFTLALLCSFERFQGVIELVAVSDERLEVDQTATDERDCEGAGGI